MTQDYKDKYPIGSQWECRDGSRAVVVNHDSDGQVSITVIKHEDSPENHWVDFEGKVDVIDGFSHRCDLIRPWVDKRVFEDAVIMCACNGGYDLFLESSKPKDIHGEPLWEVARMPFKITEGDGN